MRLSLSRSLVLSTVLSVRSSAQAPFRLEETTIAQVHAAFRAHTLTCHALVRSYLDRIEAIDKKGPAINALITLNPAALAVADSLDKRFASGGLVGPLHCIPMIVKDNFETRDLQTTAGSLALKGWIPNQDATQVARVREAGAIVLAKSNMDEWAFSPLETVSSILPGYTRNPYDLSRVTAGSSGGTAAAVASNEGEVGLGSDTGNSIRGPSSHNALVGIRSTMGLTSRAGVVPLSNTADIAGPMARTVADAVAVFNVIAGEDPADSVTAESRGHREPDYNAFVKRGALKGARIGILRQAYERSSADSEVVAVFMRALDAMKAQGAIIVDSVNIQQPQAGRGGGSGGRGGSCGSFKYDLEAYFAKRGDGAPVKTIDAIMRSGAYHPLAFQRLQAAQRDSVPPSAEGCQSFVANRERFRTAIVTAMDTLKLDALVYPTWSNPPRLIGDLNNSGAAGDNSQVYSPRSGFPAINVPMGYTRGNTLPAGVTFFGRAYSEGTLIGLAYDFEQATRVRKPPPLK
ncbi:MAG TPA: amidase family protein [Gemmatimonadaceae bacterium]|nr:amidase family protein [Gemmatimonadaceae bacterium]